MKHNIVNCLITGNVNKAGDKMKEKMDKARMREIDLFLKEIFAINPYKRAAVLLLLTNTSADLFREYTEKNKFVPSDIANNVYNEMRNMEKGIELTERADMLDISAWDTDKKEKGK